MKNRPLRCSGNIHYDVVLMDMQMPVMDGITATREIRKNQELSVPPIIAMTVNVMEDDVRKCHDAGMNDHIGKPIDPDELFRKLLRWVRIDKIAHAPESTPEPEDGAIIKVEDGVMEVDTSAKTP